MEDYLSKLNPQQQAAVTYTDGPQLVIAGAGSGKTRVLTYKIVHLLSHGYEPWRILALTFTNKAAREMRQRISALVGEKIASRLWMGTFHSIFARLLRSHADRLGYKPSFTIYDTADSKSLIKTIIRDMDLDDKVYKPSTVMAAISTAKNALVSPEEYALDREIVEADRRARRPEICNIYKAYRNRCRVAGAMDFDDLLYYTNLLLRDNPDVLRHYQEFFRYILVDEYQDTNFAQHLIVRQLAQQHGRMMVVGDDAQSIYSFRGANIRNILDLRQSYPSLQTFKLEQNYRSTKTIVDAANSLIHKNTEQIPKNVYSEGDTGARIDVVKAYTDFEEAGLVANRISQVRHTGGDSYEEFAILYRTNAQSRILEESLRNRNIPYRIYGGLSFYQRKEIKDTLAYLRLALNPDDDEALKRVINFPLRGIGDTTVGKISACAMNTGRSMWHVMHHPEECGLNVNRGTLTKLHNFCTLIGGFVAMNTAGADAHAMTTEVISRTGMMAQYIHDRTPESISKQENLQELVASVHTFVADQQEQGLPVTLDAFMTTVSLATDQDKDDKGEEERITLMTVHAAKGLEFANVFIVGVEEELFPSAMAVGSLAEIEEERRLLYVAITRAKKYCMISYAGSRFRNGMTQLTRPSRFLTDIDSCYLHPVTGTELPGGEARPMPRINPVSNYRSAPMRQPRQPRPEKAPEGMAPLHDALELKEGMAIRHPKFGRGVIQQLDGDRPDPRIIVNFEGEGTKTLLLRFARFEIL